MKTFVPPLLRAFKASFFVIILLSMFQSEANATHFRYAAYSYKILSHNPVNNTTVVQFNITQAWRSSFNWSAGAGAPGGTVTAVGQQRFVGGFNFGDGTSAPLILTATFRSPDDWFSGQATLVKTYSGSLDRVAIFQNCCRITTLSGGNGLNREYINRITVTLSDPTNNSPVVNSPPVIFVGQGLPAANIQISAFDEDGDAITYSIPTSAQSGLIQVQPPFMTSLSASGLITLNTVGVPLNSRWAIQVYLTDARGARVPVDFVIQIVTASNPPVFVYPPTPANASVITTTAGATVSFNVEATDPDPGIVNLSVIGLPIGATYNTTNGNPATGVFTWSPTLSQPGAYNLIFTAQDGFFNQATSSVTINVQPCAINISGVETDVSCSGANNGAIDLSLTGNFGNVTFAWTGPNGYQAATEDISGLATGSYTVLVTSDFGCSESETFTVGTTPDVTKPVIVCPANVTINNTPGLCSGTTTLATPKVTDNCNLEMVANGNFNLQAAGWNACGNNVEAFGTELNYGGSNGSNRVAEIDHQPVTLCQSINGFIVGQTYQLSFLASRRVGFFPAPATVGTIVTIDGGALNKTVNRSNATFNLTPETFTFVATQTTHTLSFVPTAGWSGTLGLIVDDISVNRANITNNAPATFPIGNTLVTWTATDAAGNTATCTQMVTVADNEPPVITCPAAISVSNDPGKCGATVCYLLPTVTENCKPATPSGYLYLGNFGNSYYYRSINTSVYSVAEANAKAAGGHLAVITSAAENNALIATGVGFSYIGGNDLASEGTFKWNNCEPYSFSNFCGGEPNGGTSENYLEFQTGGCWNDIGATNPRYSILEIEGAQLVQTAGLPPNSIFPVGVTTNTFVATDAAGNTSSCSFTVTVTDNEKPVPDAATLPTVTGECDASATAPTATDNCSGVLTGTTTDATSFTAQGTYVINWSYDDGNGNVETQQQTVIVKDVTAPVALCKSATVTLVGGTVSIAVGDVNEGSYDNCGIQSITASPLNFNCSNIGDNNVTLTVTDIAGNVSTCTAVVTVMGEIPTCSIASIPSSSIFTGGVSTNLYLGYGAESTTLQVSAPASGAPYTYAWSGGTLSNYNTANPVFTATTAGIFTFTVEVTNKYGCKTTCSITICVTDIRVPGTDGKKVYVCHIPAGNPGNPQTLSISVNAVPAHIGLHGGDRLGTCDMQPCTAPSIVSKKSAVAVEDAHEGLKVTVAPNPTNTHFTFRLHSENETPVSIRIVNGTGHVLESANKVNSNGTIQMGSKLLNGMYFAEFMQGTDRQVIKVMKIGSR